VSAHRAFVAYLVALAVAMAAGALLGAHDAQLPDPIFGGER